MSVGDIRNQPYATRSKEYVWSKVCSVFPRGISPSDIDHLVELNNCFFAVEGKTIGKQVDKGQALCLKRAILGWPQHKSVLVLMEHPELDRVDISTDIESVQFGWREQHEFRWASQRLTGPGCMWEVANCFVQDATSTGVLSPSAWPERIAQAGRPFEEVA